MLNFNSFNHKVFVLSNTVLYLPGRIEHHLGLLNVMLAMLGRMFLYGNSDV